MPYPHSIVDAQSWTRRGCEDVLPVRTPLAYTGVAGFYCTNFIVAFFHVVNVHLTCKISKTGDKHEATMRREEDGISWGEGEVVGSISFGVENGCLRRHVPIHYAKLLRIW